MKQYCRYCRLANLTENEDFVYCHQFKRTRHKNNCIVVNKCEHFELNEIDVFGMDVNKVYKPREKKEKQISGQIKMEVIE